MAIAYGAVGSVVYSQSDPAPAYPTGGTASRKYGYALFITTKPDTAASDQAELEAAGWTFLGAFSGGSGTTGADAGPMRVGVYWRESNTILSGTVSQITIPNNSVSSAHIERWECATNEGFDVAITGGVDSSTGSPYTVVTSSVPQDFVKTGDGLSFITSFPSDTTTSPVTWGTPTLTAQGGGTISLGTITQRVALTSTTGNDLGGRHATAMPTVSSQQQSGTLTFSSTLSGTTSRAAGPTAILRIRPLLPPSAPTSAPTAVSGVEKNVITTPATLQGGATSYSVYRDGITLVSSGHTAGAVVNDTGASVGASYGYTVRGANLLGTSTNSPSSSAVMAAPAPPSFTLKGSTDTGDAVNVIITGRPYAAVYKIYRGLSGGSRTLIHTSASQSASATYTWIDTGVVNGTSYDYAVETITASPTQTSAMSSVQTATPSLFTGYSVAFLMNGLTPNSSEQTLIDLFAQDHDVTPIQYVTGQSQVSTSDHMVVFISDSLSMTANGAFVAAVYEQFPGGLVMHGNRWSNFYLSSADPVSSTTTSSSLAIGDSTHEINAGLPNPFQPYGFVANPQSTNRSNVLTGGSEIIVLATEVGLPNSITAVAAERGDLDVLAGSFAGRRASLGSGGFGHGSATGLSALNAIGRNYLKAMIDWVGADMIPPTLPVVLPFTTGYDTGLGEAWSRGGNPLPSFGSGILTWSPTSTSHWYFTELKTAKNLADQGVLVKFSKSDAQNLQVQVRSSSVALARLNGNPRNSYSVRFLPTSADLMVYIEGSSPTILDTIPWTPSGTWDWVRLEAEGNTIRWNTWVDGSTEPALREVTDTTHATGRPNIHLLASGTQTGTVTNISEFEAYVPVPSGPAPTAPVKIWNGSAWVEAPVKIHNGSAWVVAPVKIP